MKGIEAFLKAEEILPKNKEILVSERFLNAEKKPILWIIKAITQQENAKLKEESTSQLQYYAKLCAACIVYPDLKDKKLWKSYDVAREEDALKKMLYLGEYMTLFQEIQMLNGFEKKASILKNKAKN